MNIYEPQSLPEKFIAEHYAQQHVMAALEIDEPEFWARYVTGRIPRGYSLMALTGVPLIVWPKRVLDAWHAGGCQPEPGAIELENEILHALKDAYRAEGAIFPDQIAEMN